MTENTLSLHLKADWDLQNEKGGKKRSLFPLDVPLRGTWQGGEAHPSGSWLGNLARHLEVADNHLL